MTQKLDRFLDFFEKYNRDPKMASYLNDVMHELEGEDKYISTLEMDLFQQQRRMELMNKIARTKAMAQRTLEQLRRFK